MTVRFQDLCLDAHDVDRMATFWAAVLGLKPQRRDALALLVDGTPEHTVWINPVPEPKTVKNRVHLDVHVAAVADLLALGATVIDDDQPWTVLADPEGGEFCAFVRPPGELPDYRLYELVVDCTDAYALGSWWAAAFGVELSHDPTDDVSWVAGAAGLPWELIFGPVPEPKRGKNRVHWDVVGDREELLEAGARLVRGRDAEIGWDVLADPEGNEFCVFSTVEDQAAPDTP